MDEQLLAAGREAAFYACVLILGLLTGRIINRVAPTKQKAHGNRHVVACTLLSRCFYTSLSSR
jgi:hypothetical protein